MLRRISHLLLQNLIGTITHVTTTDPAVALTFDDGPDQETTPRLLEILQRHQAKATFFMIGVNATLYPELVRQVAEAGHTVANHSWDHASFPYISGAERRAQIQKCAEALKPYGERLFRPPYGNQTIGSRLDALWMGYQVVAWNRVACDWLDYKASRLIANVADKLEPGSIVLFHDGLYDTINADYTDREPMLEAVEELLSAFSDRYRFVTIPELLSGGQVRRQFWQMKADVSFLNQLQSTVGVSHRYREGARAEKI